MLGNEVSLSDIIGDKWEFYPLVTVPSTETVDYEKVNKLLEGFDRMGAAKESVYRQFLVKMMMTIGDEIVIDGKTRAYTVLFDGLKKWIGFYYDSCVMLDFRDINVEVDIVNNLMDNFSFYVKAINGELYDIREMVSPNSTSSGLHNFSFRKVT